MKFKRTLATMMVVIFAASIVRFPILSIGTISESDDEWSMVIDGESLELLPELEEYSWVLDRPPYNPYDKIGLHRLVKSGGEPVGVIFIFSGTWSSGEQIVSDDVYCKALKAIDAGEDKIEETRNKVETRSITHYLALRGFDVYTMDYRTHFVPNTYTQNELKFMKSWGWKMYMEDAELAIDKAKEISGADKLFLGGESFGGILAMNYASVHWEEDLEGIVLLDGGSGGKPESLLPIPLPLALLKVIVYTVLRFYAMDVAGDNGPVLNFIFPLLPKLEEATGIEISIPLLNTYRVSHYSEVAEYALAHPYDPPIDPVTGKPLEPQYNDVTGEPIANYLEWAAYIQYESGTTNLYEGYNDEEALAFVAITFDRYWPLQAYLEYFSDTTRIGYESDSGKWNKDYYNFYAHYKEIDVPLIAFVSDFGLGFFGEYDPGIANQDVTGYTYPDFNHLDVYTGTYNPEMINEPTYQWLIDHL